ncbi:hypothetical protein H0H93_006463 [Arthromyces matolae]|nr:hypothetical protein H0H93_006463 [Arthromyces matolae]
MQVDNPLQPSTLFSSFNDFSDIFNADAFVDDIVNGALETTSNSHSSPAASSSRGSSPQSPYVSSLLTPPQPPSAQSFPEYNPSSFFGFEDEVQAKQIDPMMGFSANPYDFFGAFSGSDIGIDAAMGMDINTHISGMSTGLVGEAMGIDPQLVDSPAALSEIGEEIEDVDVEDAQNDGDVSASPSSSGSPPSETTKATKSRSTKRKEKEPESDEDKEKQTLVIQPVKVGGHGKARKGTVQSGGIVKKTPTTNPVTASLGKENAYVPAAPLPLPAYTPPGAYQPTNVYNHALLEKKRDEKDEDDDDLPQDWRPSPEVLAKMSSKEKRQLRNKISARNFRVRRKEYISTLEGDIAERDRLLDAIRSELGSTQSENLALRQEIAALKRTLLDGRTPVVSADGTTEYPMLNLPPPAPLPAQSAAITLQQAQAQAQQQAPALVTPNTQKDATKNGRFWGGVKLGMGMGGVTPVHRVVFPEMSLSDLLQNQFAPSPFVVAKDDKWKENVNPFLNASGEKNIETVQPEKEKEKVEKQRLVGFEGFADVNPFTMKTIDAYRMHLWGKMASQQHFNQHQQSLLQQQQHAMAQQQQHLTGLASSLRPAFFTTPNTPTQSPLASLLSGKHLNHHSPAPPYSPPPPPYSSPPSSPLLVGKGGVVEKLERERREREREREREKKETAMYAALASQTLFKKLGSAFWDAFSGSSSSTSVGSRTWDADKVKKVLEGKAVVRVVDVDEPVAGSSNNAASSKAQVHRQDVKSRSCFTATAEDLLEQSMRSLTLNKKA